jgi:hypothetical protein
MLERKTLFVVGAGASADVRFPLGTRLVQDISKALDFRARSSGKVKESCDDLRRIITALEPAKAGENLEKCERFRISLEHSDSIDEAINDFRSDHELVRCAKVTIAYFIAKSEQRSQLNFGKPIDKSPTLVAEPQPNWYELFFRLLKSGAEPSNPETLFRNVWVICFNYDRCIEQYIYYAMRRYYNLSAEEADGHLNKLDIIHPYGTIGKFWINSRSGETSFGSQRSDKDLIEQSDALRTVYESDHDKEKLERIHRMVEGAQQIVFLGFGFHQLNMKLLTPPNQSLVGRIFATAMREETPNQVVFKKRITAMFSHSVSYGFWKEHQDDIALEDAGCDKLLERYRATLSSSWAR